MRPSFTMLYLPNDFMRDPKPFSHIGLRFTLREKFFDHWNVAIFEFSVNVLFSPSGGERNTSTFLPHVVYVILVCSEEQVIWAHAWRVVAAVKDVHSPRKSTEVDFIRQAMSGYEHRLAHSVNGAKRPVTAASSCPFPRPAAIAPANEGPKAIYQRLRCSAPCTARSHREIVGIHGDTIAQQDK
jgi:hypothetical protein